MSVRALQTKLNEFFDRFRVPAEVIVDGELGPATRDAIRTAKLCLGYRPRFASGRRTPGFYARLARPLGPLTTHSQRVRGLAYRRSLRGGVRGQAARILQLADSGRIEFWTGLSTGSERRLFAEIVRTGKGRCPQTGEWLTPNPNVLAAIISAAALTPVMVNAVTGGLHGGPDGNERTNDSRHYFFQAIDFDRSRGDRDKIDAAMREHGGTRNAETSHWHYDFPPY